MVEIPAIPCNQLYADEIAAERALGDYSGFWSSEFNQFNETEQPEVQWMCPNTTSMSILNNFYSISNPPEVYQAFEAEVVTCSWDQAKKGTSYWDSLDGGEQTCETNS